MNPGGETENALSQTLASQGIGNRDLLAKSDVSLPSNVKVTKPTSSKPDQKSWAGSASFGEPKMPTAKFQKQKARTAIVPKGKTVQQRISSMMFDPRYQDKKDTGLRDHVVKQFKKAYPGTVQFDETGQMMQPQPVIKPQEVEAYVPRKVQSLLNELPEQGQTSVTNQNQSRRVDYPQGVSVRTISPQSSDEFGTGIPLNADALKDASGYSLEPVEQGTSYQVAQASQTGVMSDAIKNSQGRADQKEDVPDYEPSVEDLKKYAPERDWTHATVNNQKRTIDTLTSQGEKYIKKFHQRVPEAKREKEFLAFDGTKMMHVREGKVLRVWPAVSGRAGFQGANNQNQKDKGPLPEGRWSLKQDRHQSFPKDDKWDQTKGIFGRGKWRGGRKSWGENRFWISGPNGEKNPSRLGRSGFSIHGGDNPGSAGCIDATEYMADFTAYFKRQGKDLPLIVSYPY